MLLDAGNALYSGSRQDLNRLSEGRVTIEAMNAMGYDAMAIGPYDLAIGLPLLDERLAEAEFPALSANLMVNGDPWPQPYVVLRRDTLRVAVIGLTAAPSAPLEGVEVTDPATALREVVAAVADQADLVLVLSNLGPRVEAELAQAVTGIDVIVGGGSGVPQKEVAWQAGAALVRGGGLGEYLGITEIDPEGISFHSMGLGPDVPDDPDMAALKERYQNEYLPASTVTPG